MAYIFPLSQPQLDVLKQMGENPDNPMFIMLGDGTLQISDTTFIAPNGNFISQAPVDPYETGLRPVSTDATPHIPEDSIIPPGVTPGTTKTLPWKALVTVGVIGAGIYFLLKV
jgi:hypothetical protein